MHSNSEIFEAKTIYKIFGKNLRALREAKGLGLKELAEAARYNRNLIAKVEFGEQNICYQSAISIARALGVHFPALFSQELSANSALLKTIISSSFCEDNYLLVFIENFRKELRSHTTAQTSVYIKTGIPEATLSRILNGKKLNPTIRTLYAMSFSSGIPMERLFTRGNLEEKQ